MPERAVSDIERAAQSASQAVTTAMLVFEYEEGGLGD